jgi:hypothetical protein
MLMPDLIPDLSLLRCNNAGGHENLMRSLEAAISAAGNKV